MVMFWLRYGYVFCDLVTIWLRKSTIWLRFGYAETCPGKNMVTQFGGMNSCSECDRVFTNDILDTIWLRAPLPRITILFGYVF